MTRDQKIMQVAQLGIDVLTGYILLRRIVDRYLVIRSSQDQVSTSSSAMG